MSKYQKILFSTLGKEASLRNDVGYINFIYLNRDKTKIKFTELFEILKPQEIDISKLSEINYCQIGDIDSNGNKFPVQIDLSQEDMSNDYYKKIIKGDIFMPNKHCILISKVRPYLNKIILIENNEKIYYTKAFICLRPKINTLIAYYLLKNTIINHINYFSRQGKGYPTIKEDDLKKIEIENIDFNNLINVSSEVIDNIHNAHNKIQNIFESIVSLNNIIDSVFADYFHYDFDKFNNLKNQKIFQANFASYGNNIDTRFSAKFHRPAGEFVYSQLKKSDYYKLKNVVSIPMITGQGISSEYDENGSCSYVSMADISTWELDLDNLKTVSPEYEKKNSTKKIKGIDELQSTKLAINDIVMMRSGEGGIGKVAIIKDEIDAIFCDFLIRIRLDKSVINPQFAYYYFRTTYFQYLVEINKKGLGNNTNIFPNILNEFPIPNIDLKEQEKIVAQIEKKIEEQESIKKQIITERKEIDRILGEVLK